MAAKLHGGQTTWRSNYMAAKLNRGQTPDRYTVRGVNTFDALSVLHPLCHLPSDKVGTPHRSISVVYLAYFMVY